MTAHDVNHLATLRAHFESFPEGRAYLAALDEVRKWHQALIANREQLKALQRDE